MNKPKKKVKQMPSHVGLAEKLRQRRKKTEEAIKKLRAKK